MVDLSRVVWYVLVMEHMISILSVKHTKGNERKSTLVLEEDGSIRVMGNLPHGYSFIPASHDDALKLQRHLDWITKAT